MKKIIVLHIITRLIRGGADENTILNIRGLEKDKFKVDLVVGGESDPTILNQLDGINCIKISALKRNIQPWWDVIALLKLVRLIRKNRYLIVHTHTAKAGFLGRIAAKLSGTPIIVHTLHGTTFHDLNNPIVKKIYIALERFVAYFTDKFIAVGDDLKKKYLDQKIGSFEQYTTIHSGFEIAAFIEAGRLSDTARRQELDKIGISEDTIVIGTVSRLEPRKGHVYLFHSAQKIVDQSPNVKFLIAGEGYYRNKLEQQVEQFKLSDSIKFLGYRSDIAKIISIFDVFLLTSLWEGLPRVLVQAALLGKPVVTFDVEGAREVVKHGVNGFIVPLRDTESLAQKLLVFVRNLDLARDMGRHGKEIVGNRWGAVTMIEKTKQVYKDLIAAKNYSKDQKYLSS
jgi:glycosyltransferase involved in cell wall biosynthesis